MASSGLSGPYALNEATIDSIVTRKSPGAYALGNTSDNTYYINYVGRSDIDLNARLKQHVGAYPQFKYGYQPSPKAAFDKECGLYHDFQPPDNKVHPARPQGSGWSCPRCDIFD
jgi:hypothetical protein